MFRKNVVMMLGFLFTLAMASVAFAEEGASATSAPSNLKVALAIAAGFGMALASVGGAWSQSKALSTAVDGIARNPGAQGKIFIPMIVGLALIESLVLLTFVVTNGLAGKI
jgi:F-type H+-transporting ATPase subunit c